MRVAAIYDIHANLPALEAVLQQIRKEPFDAIVVGGDVLPGPMPRETLACLFSSGLPLRFILGNCEAEVLKAARGDTLDGLPEQARAPTKWNADQLDAESIARIARWPMTVQLDVEDLGAVLFCHATPRSNTEIFTRLTPEERVLELFGNVDAAVVVCGHTHMQFDRQVAGLRVVNAGSVGMPFGDSGAYWVSLGPSVSLRGTPYDLEDAARRIRQTAYPQAQDFAKNNVLCPPTEQEVLAAFVQMESR